MKIGLDTSVVVRLLIGEPAIQAEAARRLLADRQKGETVAVSDVVLGETYFALRHHYRVPHHEVVEALAALGEDPVFELGSGGKALFSKAPGSITGAFMDRLIHAGYRADDAEYVTFDRDAARLEGARLLTAD